MAPDGRAMTERWPAAAAGSSDEPSARPLGFSPDGEPRFCQKRGHLPARDRDAGPIAADGGAAALACRRRSSIIEPW